MQVSFIGSFQTFSDAVTVFTKEQTHLSLVSKGCLVPRGMKWQEAGEKLHNEELDSFYSSAHIISTIKSRRMRWVVHVISIMVIRNIQ